MIVMDQPVQVVKIRRVESTQPFNETLRSIMDMADVSNRELTRRCRERGWGSLATINRLVLGEVRPSMNAMESIATALKVKPETFSEYRLGKARRQLDPEQVGLSKALKALNRFER